MGVGTSVRFKRTRWLAAAAAFAAVAPTGVAPSPVRVEAVHDELLFELEGDAEEFNAGAPFGPAEDAETIYNADLGTGSTNASAFDFVADGVDGEGAMAAGPGGTVVITPVTCVGSTQCDRIFTGGGSKDDLDMTGWLWTLSKPQPKDDITHGFAAAYDKEGDSFLYFGGSRWSNDGAAHIGLWLLKNEVCFDDPNNDGSGDFGCGGNPAAHAIGDILVLANFTGGGANANQQVYEWVGGTNGDEDGDGDLDGPLDLIGLNADCDTVVANDDGCANNSEADKNGPWPISPWPFDDRDTGGDPAPAFSFADNEYFEGGINLTDTFGDDLGCFTNFLLETRSTGESLDSTLSDLLAGNFDQCALEIVKGGDTLSKVGDSAHYTFEISNPGSITLYLDTVTDTLLGDLEDDAPASCDVLAPGASCSFSVDRVVQAGDPDPLPNTVTAVYDTKVTLDGDTIDATDDHSVNLFQPSITVDKTGDTLSKVGDGVNYTITISNTSSADSPALVFDSISDTLLGNLADAANTFVTGNTCAATIAAGASCSITATRIVQAADPDPLPNTVTVHAHPDGFPNDITDSDDHSVNLFQPSVGVQKVCDPLSKVGDPVHCTVTVTNTSSADSPALVNAAVSDTLAGNLLGTPNANVTITTDTCTAAFGDGFAPAESCSIAYDYVVQAGDPDPLPNSVTVTFNPQGFPNVIQGSASTSTQLFQPSITLVKSGDELSKIGDPVTYTFTITNTSSADAPALVFDSLTDDVLGDLFGANPLVTNSTCGSSLPSGGSCVVTAVRTVDGADPDPLVNVATVHAHPDGFPNDITATDNHSVNLFQPSIVIDKGGDALSKVGDPANYTITVTNTSSPDSPHLVLASVIDSLLGDLLDPTNPLVTSNGCGPVGSSLAPGGLCVITASRMVQVGDADPLPNTVTVHANPAGFPNDITDSDDHEVNLFQPSVTVDKTGDTLSKATDPARYTVTVTNTSSGDSPNLINPSVSDTVAEDLLGTLDPNATIVDDTCTAAFANGFAPGESCHITYDYVVQVGDPDPLVNTVAVHFNPDGFPNDITSMDSHTVNLFQPAINLTKTGDLLSKIGDPVNYVITLANNSSTDTPDLVCTVTDATAGVNEQFTVAAGDSHVINVNNFVIPVGASDPFVNTASASCSPTGFPNVLTDTASWSTNLFQPSITLDKTGDTLSKIGDEVTYTITLTNTSSADSPDLVCSVTDPVIGLDEQVQLASGASQSYNVPFTIPQTNADPFPNTASASCSPVGFPNVIPASDSHNVNLFQPSIDVVKTGPDFSKVGDTATYTVTITNTSSADSPALNLQSFTDSKVPGVVPPASCDTLAPGASCQFTYPYTVVAGDDSGAVGATLTNTASATYSPTGFPNQISDSDSHTLTLLHPSFTLSKVCAAEPVSRSGPAVFTVTVVNTGDAILVVTADDGIGAFALAVGQTRTFSVSVPGPFTGPDSGFTVSNTVSATAALAAIYNLPNTYSAGPVGDQCDVKGLVKVVKTVDGLPPAAGQTFTFELRQGASVLSDGTVLESKTTDASGNITFSTELVPGQTYQICEVVMPGWNTTLSGDGPLFVPNSMQTPTLPNPNVNNMTVCTNFTVASGQTRTFTVDNSPPPGGRALTIGFWKNWASCANSNGKGQKPVLDQTLALASVIGDTTHAGHSTLPGIVVSATSGTYPVFGPTYYLVVHGNPATPNTAPDCQIAVRLLDKSTINTGKKQASDPAFNLAAQLLAAELNLTAGAASNPTVLIAINQSVLLLGKYQFNGITHTNISKADATAMNCLAAILDDYNNNRPLGC